MGHTKGEWKWYNGCSWWRLGTKEGRGMKDMVLRPTNDTDGHPNLICSELDRQLIAAAPDLLEACEDALRMLDAADWSKSDIDYKAIQQAISKATK